MATFSLISLKSAWAELGPAQPQLVYYYCWSCVIYFWIYVWYFHSFVSHFRSYVCCFKSYDLSCDIFFILSGSYDWYKLACSWVLIFTHFSIILFLISDLSYVLYFYFLIFLRRPGFFDCLKIWLTTSDRNQAGGNPNTYNPGKFSPKNSFLF